MNAAAALFMAAGLLLITGCASFDVRRYYTEPFCVPKAKWDRHKERAYVGVRCAF